jgi:hypothetical protein
MYEIISPNPTNFLNDDDSRMTVLGKFLEFDSECTTGYAPPNSVQVNVDNIPPEEHDIPIRTKLKTTPVDAAATAEGTKLLNIMNEALPLTTNSDDAFIHALKYSILCGGPLCPVPVYAVSDSITMNTRGDSHAFSWADFKTKKSTIKNAITNFLNEVKVSDEETYLFNHNTEVDARRLVLVGTNFTATDYNKFKAKQAEINTFLKTCKEIPGISFLVSPLPEVNNIKTGVAEKLRVQYASNVHIRSRLDLLLHLLAIN